MITLPDASLYVANLVPSPDADVEPAKRSLDESVTREQIQSSPFDLDCIRSIVRAGSFNGSADDDQAGMVLRRIGRAWRQEGTHVALVLVFKELDALMRAGLIEECDEVLRRASSDFGEMDLSASQQLIIGILTATLPIRSKLKSRPVVLERVGSLLGELGLSREEVLAGL